MIRWFWFFLLFPLFVYGNVMNYSVKKREQIQNRLIIEDFEGAFREVHELLKKDDSFPGFSLALKVCMSLGKEEEWMRLWQQGCQRFSQEELYSRELLEDFCWSILKKGSTHSSGLVRLFTLLSAVYSHDLRAEKYILQSMQDDDILVQMLAVKMVEHYATPDLKKRISSLLNKKEVSLIVKLEILDIIGKLKMSSEKKTLFNIMKDRYASSAEKRVTVRSLVAMEDLQSFQFLFNKEVLDIQSTLVVCELIRTYNLLEYKDFLLKIAENSCSEVQQVILCCLISLDKDFISEEELCTVGRKFLHRKYPLTTRFLAAKLLLLHNFLEGKEFFEQALSSSEILVVREAAGILLSSGEPAVPLAKKFLLQVTDEQAAVDLSILLLLRQENRDEAVTILSNFLKKNIENPVTRGTELLFIQENKESNVSENISDFHLSMTLLHLLALSDYPCQNELLPLFLEHKWKQGFSGLLNVLWEDRPNEVLRLISSLKDSPSKVARLEAVLSRACLLRDEESLSELEDMYTRCSWQEKIRILEVFSTIEQPRRIDFLLNCCCTEEMVSLKIIAAGSLLIALQ